MPPIIMIGTWIASVQVSSASICTCCTSLVLRVMSDGAPNCATSRPENEPTRWKTAPRTSRPNDIAVLDAQATAITEQMIWRNEIASMTAPVRTM